MIYGNRANYIDRNRRCSIINLFDWMYYPSNATCGFLLKLKLEVGKFNVEKLRHEKIQVINQQHTVGIPILWMCSYFKC